MNRKFFILIPIALILSLPYVVMILWNKVVVDIFDIKTITYWQALGLFVLCRILVGGFRWKGRHKPPFAQAHFKARWLNMTDEEKQQFKERWKNRKNSC